MNFATLCLTSRNTKLQQSSFSIKELNDKILNLDIQNDKKSFVHHQKNDLLGYGIYYLNKK